MLVALFTHCVLHAFGTGFGCKTIASEANVNQACHGRNEFLFLRFARFLGGFEFRLWAIVDIRAARLPNGGLRAWENQTSNGNPCGSDPLPDLQPVVISL